jgi:hypothetical protein
VDEVVVEEEVRVDAVLMKTMPRTSPTSGGLC